MRKTGCPAVLLALIVAGFFLSGCAALGLKSEERVNVLSSDRVFLRITPFDTTVRAELTRVGLDPAKIQENLASELHYQMFLKKQEESPDSAGATVRVSVSLEHIQPGTGNSGSFVTGNLVAERGGKAEQANWESRQPAKDNVPVEFLPLHLPRSLAGDILSHMKSKAREESSTTSDMERNPPLMLLH